MKPKSLTVSKYVLKPDQPRVRARIETVLQFFKPYLLLRKPTSISSAVLTKVFGNQNSPQAARLRAMLLVQSGTYMPKVHSYSYTVKRDGYAKLAALIGMPVASDVEMARELYGEIAAGTEFPEYTEPTKGARRYHAVQNLPKTLRAELFTGWFDYDIEAAAPTLVYQLASSVYRKWHPEKSDAMYPSVKRLVDDRTAVRQHIADVTGLDFTCAKGIVVALFFGARLVPHEKQAIFRLVRSDREVMERLKADPFVKAFRRDVSAMWLLLLIDENARNGVQGFRTGVIVPKPETKSKQKMAMYLRLERQVIEVVETELRQDGAVPVLIHDGFMVRGKIDKASIERAVQRETGFVIRLAEARVGMKDQSLKFSLPEADGELIYLE